jgi:PmbA protein
MVSEKLFSRVRETSISIVQTKLDSVRRKDIRKTGMRIYKDSFIGVAGTIGATEGDSLHSRAEEALEHRISYPYAPTTGKRHASYNAELPGEEQLAGEVEAVLEVLRKEQPNFSFSNKVNRVEWEKALENDAGLDLRFQDCYMAFELVFKENASSNIMDGWVGFEGRRYDRKLLLEHANDICTAYQNKVELPGEGKYPVIFSTQQGRPLLKLLSDLNGRTCAMGSSLLSGKRGKKIFSSRFSLYQSLDPEEGLSSFFDAEGTVQEGFRYPLIRDGVFECPYTDKRTAALYDLPLTGAAVADYDGVPNLPSYLGRHSIGCTAGTLDDLLGGEKGIFVLIAEGGDFTQTGEFATPIQLAFLYEGGKLIGRLPEFQVSSHLFEMYGDAYRGTAAGGINPLSMEKYMVMDLKVSKS